MFRTCVIDCDIVTENLKKQNEFEHLYSTFSDLQLNRLWLKLTIVIYNGLTKISEEAKKFDIFCLSIELRMERYYWRNPLEVFGTNE